MHWRSGEAISWFGAPMLHDLMDRICSLFQLRDCESREPARPPWQRKGEFVTKPIHSGVPCLGWWTKTGPLWLLLFWLMATVALFEFGPYKYPVANHTTLIVYLTAVHAALVLGYLRGVGRWSLPLPISQVR